MSDEPKYLNPRSLFDSAIINEGFHVVYSYEKVMRLLVDDYITEILETTSFKHAPLSMIEIEATRRARKWITYLSEAAFYNVYRAPLISHTCSQCNTVIVGEIGLCPSTQYQKRCTTALHVELN